MWQRFTERSRKAIFFAQGEATRLSQTFVAPEHFLLGLIREEDTVASRVLTRIGVSLGDMRGEIERHAPTGNRTFGQEIQLDEHAKKVIDLAYDEARLLANNYIGTEHLLLGLLRLEDGLTARVFAKFGVTLERDDTNKGGGYASWLARVFAKFGVTLERVREEVLKLQDVKGEVPSEAAVRKTIAEQADALRHAAQNAAVTPEQVIEVNALREAIAADAAGWRKKSVLSLFDISATQIRAVLNVAAGLKKYDLARQTSLYWAYPRTLALLFEKPSLRTRVSFEVSMAHLQGQAIYLAPGDVGLGTREAVPDVAEALARWVDILAARVFQHETIEELAANSSIPVINALSDREHPIQAFADLLTLEEQKGPLGNNIKLAYVGDGNNVLHALLLACAKMGVHCTAAYPDGYAPDARYVTEAQRIGQETGARIELLTDPVAAVAGADAVYTDVWASMGQESEKESRSQIFAPYQINAELLRHAKSDAIVLHCLPAHRGEEVSADIMARHKTVVFDQAENRLHTQKALLVLILGL